MRRRSKCWSDGSRAKTTRFSVDGLEEPMSEEQDLLTDPFTEKQWHELLKLHAKVDDITATTTLA